MDTDSKLFALVLLGAALLCIGLLISNYYPAHNEEITVKKIIVGDRECILVACTDEAYYINFETYATTEVGGTYIGTITHPIFSGEYIDHLKRIDAHQDKSGVCPP